MTEEVVRSLSRGGGHPRVEREGEVAEAALGGDRRDICQRNFYINRHNLQLNYP